MPIIGAKADNIVKQYPIIEYESVVSAYIENLSTTLRGFVPAEGLAFLETWVPDEDPLPSILGIFEAASQAGIPGVTVRVQSQTLAASDVPSLASKAAAWGEPRFQADAETSLITLSFAREDQLQSVSLLYRPALEVACESHDYEGVIEPKTDAILATASHEELKLMALVRGERHIITTARYSGTCSEIYRGLMERLCPTLQGKPILEASDHAVIELESSLRDRTQPLPAPGVIMPENCDPMFAVPLHLVRGLLADYRRSVGFRTTDNFYLPPCTPRWRDLSHERQRSEVAAAVATFPGGSDFEVLAIEGDRRVVIRIAPGVSKGAIGSRLLGIEQHLQKVVEPVLQIHLPAKSDLNTIRRIKEVRN